LQGRRNQGMNRAKQAVESDRFRSLGLRTALWILGGGGRSAGKMTQALCARPAADFAAETLADRLKKILKKARRIERLDPRERHKLRIAVKKLRYGADFFGSLFDRGRTQFARQLKVLQNALGRLNDIEVHKRVAGEIVHRGAVPARPGKALAMGFVNGYERAQIEPCIAAVTKAAKRLARTTPFWE
jgi:triphosphatase